MIKHDFSFSPSFWKKTLFNISIIYSFCSFSNDSKPPIIKHELNSHFIALYKKEVISSLVISLLHINIFWAFGLFPVKYL